MRDYSKYEKTPVLFSGAEKKFEIIIDGFRYIVKFQKNSEVGLTFNYVSEYLGSHIFQLLGIPVQETFLGTYEGKNVVVMKNFLEPEDDLVAFNGVGESSLERDKELYQYTYEDITAMLRENMKSTNALCYDTYPHPCVLRSSPLNDQHRLGCRFRSLFSKLLFLSQTRECYLMSSFHLLSGLGLSRWIAAILLLIRYLPV